MLRDTPPAPDASALDASASSAAFDRAEALDVVWARLAEVRALRFVARARSGSGWTGTGRGTVAVARHGAAALTFTEAGAWSSPAGKAFPFRNAFRWTRRAGVLRLEHLRFGPDRPVLLFDLAPASATAWRSVAPHVCRDDRYAATMVLAPDALDVRWRAWGPAKDEHIRYAYTRQRSRRGLAL